MLRLCSEARDKVERLVKEEIRSRVRRDYPSGSLSRRECEDIEDEVVESVRALPH